MHSLKTLTSTGVFAEAKAGRKRLSYLANEKTDPQIFRAIPTIKIVIDAVYAGGMSIATPDMNPTVDPRSATTIPREKKETMEFRRISASNGGKIRSADVNKGPVKRTEAEISTTTINL